MQFQHNGMDAASKWSMSDSVGGITGITANVHSEHVASEQIV